MTIELGLAFAAATGAVPPKLLLGAALLCAGASACVFAPRTALLGLAGLWGATHTILLDFQLGSLGGFDITLSRGLGVVVVVGFGLSFLTRDSSDEPPLPFGLKALCLFLFLFAVDTALAASRVDAFSDFMRVASGVVIGIAAFRLIDTPGRLAALVRVVVWGAVVVAVVTILEFALVTTVPGLAEKVFGRNFYYTSVSGVAGSVSGVAGPTAVRVNGPLGYAAVTARFLVVAIGFTLLQVSIKRRPRTDRGALIVLALLSVGVLITLTRSAVIAFLVLLITWVLQRQYRPGASLKVRGRILGLLALLVLGTLPFLTSTTVRNRLWDVNPLASGTHFAQGRGGLWLEEVDLLRHSAPLELLVGHGAHASYIAVETFGSINTEGAHNLVLWLLVETGVIGAAIYFLFLGSLVREYSRAARRYRFTSQGQIAATALAMLAAYAVIDIFSLTVNAPGDRWYLMLLIGATLRAASVWHEQDEPVSEHPT